MKYKKNDRVVVISNAANGEEYNITPLGSFGYFDHYCEIDHEDCYVCFIGYGSLDVKIADLELEEVIKSPLYKALS